MEHAVVKNALGEIERALEVARKARSQIEMEQLYGEHRGGFEEPAEALASSLNDAFEMLAVILEAAGMLRTRIRLLQRWQTFEKKGGLKETSAGPEWVESEPLTYVDTVLSALRAASGGSLPSSEAFELSKLETLLRRTAELVRKRGVVPLNEADIQTVMHDYLEALFIEYQHPVHITGVLKNCQPDGGVRDLKAAIEFKYAATKQEVATGLSGVFEDVSGYSGSHDWIRFYTVMYQTEAFESEERFRHDMARAAAPSWTAILVTGSGTRKSEHTSAVRQKTRQRAATTKRRLSPRDLG